MLRPTERTNQDRTSYRARTTYIPNFIFARLHFVKPCSAYAHIVTNPMLSSFPCLDELEFDEACQALLRRWHRQPQDHGWRRMKWQQGALALTKAYVPSEQTKRDKQSSDISQDEADSGAIEGVGEDDVTNTHLRFE